MTKITAKEFNDMFTEQRAEYLWENGTFIDERIVYNKYIIKIYSLLDFWVEVYYSIDDNKIEDIHAISTEEEMENFLKHIDLIDLF